MSNKNISVAMIGAGYMADEHIKAFQALNGVSVDAIYSRTLQKAVLLGEKYQIKNICKSIDELFQKTQPDLVVIAVTETSVHGVIERLSKYPQSAILVEKPVGLDYFRAQETYEIVEQKKLRVVVGLNRRFYGATQNVYHDLISSKGDRFLQVNDYQSLHIARSFNYAKNILDHWMYANSIHLIDYFSLFCRGDVTDVKVVQAWNPDKLSPVVAHIKYDSGDSGVYHGVWHGPGPWSVSVVTETDYFEMKPLEQAARRTALDRNLIIYPQTKADQIFKPGLYEQAKEAVKFTHGVESKSVTLLESLKTMKLIHSIYQV